MRKCARFLDNPWVSGRWATRRRRWAACHEEVLVPFSCKGRLCASCTSRRAHDAAAHLVDVVLPEVPFRQWTVAFPWRLRWVLLRDGPLLSLCLRELLRAVSG